MKSILNNKIVLSAMVLLTAITILSACKKDGKFFKKDLNTDPNQLATLSKPGILLTNAELTLAYTQGGDLSRYTGVIMQQSVGSLNQFIPYNTYTFSSTDFDNSWLSMYTGNMNNLNQIITISNTNNLIGYRGVAKALMAYSITLTADMWGDVPYSQAFKGLDNFHPAYDKGAAIYSSAFALLNDALADLNNPNNSLDKYPVGADDLIYNGNYTHWIKFCHALKARLYLHERKVVASAADSALVELSNAFTDASDDAMFSFANATNGNPHTQFEWNDRPGYIDYLGSSIYGFMSSKSDPRLGLWIDTLMDIVGPTFGSTIDVGQNLTATAPVYFITFTEQKFIEAELNYIKGNGVAAVQADSAAIQASFDMAGISGSAAAYIAAHPCATSGTNQLRDIMYEKYIALFTHPEVWSDYRRTGYPALTPTVGANIPRKFLYPQSEYFYNASNIPSATTMFSKVWWDN